MQNNGYKITNVTLEIAARIVKATAKKYGYNVSIDFSNGRQFAKFHGPKKALETILDEVFLQKWDGIK